MFVQAFAPGTLSLPWITAFAKAKDSDLTEEDHVILVFDPFLDENPKSNITTADIDRLDYVLCSHGHFDHIADAAEIANRCGATVIANYEIATWLWKNPHAVQNTIGMNLGGSVSVPFGRVKMTLAFHSSSLPDGSNGGNPCGFLLTTNDGKKIYLAQDTGLFGDMKLIGEEGLDLAVIPIGDNYTMGPDDALRAVKFLEPKVVIPIHYNTFNLLAQDESAWAQRVQKETNAKVVVLKPGESFTL